MANIFNSFGVFKGNVGTSGAVTNEHGIFQGQISNGGNFVILDRHHTKTV